MAAQPNRPMGNVKHTMTENEIRERVHLASVSEQDDLTIVAIGITGAGKSTFLNMLAGKDVFATAGGVMGCTDKVQKEVVRFQTRTFALIDTPGLLDPKILDKALSQGKKCKVLLSQQSAVFETHLEKALNEAGEKVDVFLLVINVKSRWSAEAEWVVEILNTLGLDYKHMIAVFTHGDGLGKTKGERYKQMEVRLNDPRAAMYRNLKDLMGLIESR